MSYALVTGASSGFGKSLSIQLARRGYDLKLVARNELKLQQLKRELEATYHIKVIVIAMDLSIESAAKQLFLEHRQDVSIVINNAGIGYAGEFGTMTEHQHEQMLALNINSVHVLTYLFLNQFQKQNKGYILNVASTAAFCSGPLMATYYATKSYVFHLTEAIGYELKKKRSNVVVSVCCPGPMATDFHKRAQLNTTRPLPSTDEVAEQTIQALFAKRQVILLGHSNRLLVIFNKLLPSRLVLDVVHRNQLKKMTFKK